jgi:hypothetical protein
VSAWILGSEFVGSLGLKDFEFVQEYVSKNLDPHNHLGQPYMPAAVVDQFIQSLEQEHAQHEDLAWNLSGYDREEVIANHIEPLQRRIHDLRLYHDSLNGSVWEGFQLPQDQNLARYFIQVLLNSFYRRDEADKYLPPVPATVPMAAQVEKPAKPRKLTRDQRRKIDCRAAAQKIWFESPEITIDDMIRSDEITNACEGHIYDKPILRRWINDLCPNRKPGRPKKKKT